MKFLLVYGNPIAGLTFCGPFDSRYAALEWAEKHIVLEYDWWIATIHDPKED